MALTKERLAWFADVFEPKPIIYVMTGLSGEQYAWTTDPVTRRKIHAMSPDLFHGIDCHLYEQYMRRLNDVAEVQMMPISAPELCIPIARRVPMFAHESGPDAELTYDKVHLRPRPFRDEDDVL